MIVSEYQAEPPYLVDSQGNKYELVNLSAGGTGVPVYALRPVAVGGGT